MLTASVGIAFLPARTIQGPGFAIDGDTIVVSGIHIRIAGIDAPESDQQCFDRSGTSYPCGTIATARMRQLIRGKILLCRRETTDAYGRTVATCKAEDMDLGQEMVREGLAVAYRHFSLAYIQDEDDARSAHRGIWQGRFQFPWRWRQDHRQ